MFTTDDHLNSHTSTPHHNIMPSSKRIFLSI